MTTPYSHNYYYDMRGSIRCAKRGCDKERKSLVCTNCGHPTVYISLYWKGKHYKYWRDRDDHPLVDYRKASSILSAMHLEINEEKFNPFDWTAVKLRERKFENKIWEWIKEKTEAAEAGEFSFETIKSYRGFVKNYFLSHFGGWDIKEIGDEQIIEFAQSLRTVMGIKTRRNILNGLHAFFAWLKRMKVIQLIPEWPEIKGDNAKPRTAVDRQTQMGVLQLIPECHRDVIEFLTETGLRSGELCALQVRDVDLKMSRALIQRTWSGAKLKESTKTNSKDYIIVSERAMEIIKKHFQDKHPHSFLFINPETGKCYRAKKLNEIIKQAGVNITAHEFGRHSFCTQIARTSGANVFDAQALMRHKDLHSTRKYYHIDVKRISDILNRRGEVINLQDEKQGKQNESRTDFQGIEFNKINKLHGGGGGN